MELYREIIVATIGMDCPATLAWVNQLVADNIAARTANADALRRSAVHWQAASAEMQQAIATKLGWTDPMAQLIERWPVPPGIRSDYEYTVEFISQAIIKGATQYDRTR
jgi:hypothetical protein